MGKLVCIGGGEIPRIKDGIQLPYETKEIDEEIVRISGKQNPKLLFIGTASSHSFDYFLVIKKIYEDLGCIVSNLDLLQDSINMEQIEMDILNSDIIYVGGGNTRFMLRKWKELGVDKILLKAYENGIVCSGLSAGIGIVNAINCVHYEEKDDEAKNKFYNVIKEKGLVGIALDNCVALELIDGKVSIIKSNKDKNAYKIMYANNKIIEEKM